MSIALLLGELINLSPIPRLLFIQHIPAQPSQLGENDSLGKDQQRSDILTET